MCEEIWRDGQDQIHRISTRDANGIWKVIQFLRSVKCVNLITEKMVVFHLMQMQIEHRYEIYMETLQKMEIQIVNMK